MRFVRLLEHVRFLGRIRYRQKLLNSFIVLFKGCEDFTCLDGSCVAAEDVCEGTTWHCSSHEDEFGCEGKIQCLIYLY